VDVPSLVSHLRGAADCWFAVSAFKVKLHHPWVSVRSYHLWIDLVLEQISLMFHAHTKSCHLVFGSPGHD
jgi:hypothetical protein